MREVNSSFLTLEHLNGGGMILTTAFLFLIALYLYKESARRKLTPGDWVHLRIPPSMHFAIAIAICDTGIGLRSGIAWAWRRFFNAEPFGSVMFGLLMLSAAMIAIGFVCKIRAISKPDWGDGPWLLSIAAVIAFLVWDLYFG